MSIELSVYMQAYYYYFYFGFASLVGSGPSPHARPQGTA